MKVKLWLDGLGRGHHCMGDDETAEDTYGRPRVSGKTLSEKMYEPLLPGGRRALFERYKLASRVSISSKADIWVGSVSLSSMSLATERKA